MTAKQLKPTEYWISEALKTVATKADYSEIRENYEDEDFKKGWGLLNQEQKARIHAICSQSEPVQSDNKVIEMSQKSRVKSDKTISELTLGELSIEAKEVFSQIIEGELTEDELNTVLDQLETKIDATCWVRDFLQAEQEAAKARLEMIKSRLESQVKYLEVALKNLDNRLLSLHKQGLLSDKNQGQERVITFRNYPVVDVKVDPENLPDEFKTTKVTVSPNKTALKKALETNPDEVGVIAELVDNFKVSVGFNRKK